MAKDVISFSDYLDIVENSQDYINFQEKDSSDIRMIMQAVAPWRHQTNGTWTPEKFQTNMREWIPSQIDSQLFYDKINDRLTDKANFDFRTIIVNNKPVMRFDGVGTEKCTIWVQYDMSNIKKGFEGKTQQEKPKTEEQENGKDEPKNNFEVDKSAQEMDGENYTITGDTGTKTTGKYSFDGKFDSPENVSVNQKNAQENIDFQSAYNDIIFQHILNENECFGGFQGNLENNHVIFEDSGANPSAGNQVSPTGNVNGQEDQDSYNQNKSEGEYKYKFFQNSLFSLFYGNIVGVNGQTRIGKNLQVSSNGLLCRPNFSKNQESSSSGNGILRKMFVCPDSEDEYGSTPCDGHAITPQVLVQMIRTKKFNGKEVNVSSVINKVLDNIRSNLKFVFKFVCTSDDISNTAQKYRTMESPGLDPEQLKTVVNPNYIKRYTGQIRFVFDDQQFCKVARFTFYPKRTNQMQPKPSFKKTLKKIFNNPQNTAGLFGLGFEKLMRRITRNNSRFLHSDVIQNQNWVIDIASSLDMNRFESSSDFTDEDYMDRFKRELCKLLTNDKDNSIRNFDHFDKGNEDDYFLCIKGSSEKKQIGFVFRSEYSSEGKREKLMKIQFNGKTQQFSRQEICLSIKRHGEPVKILVDNRYISKPTIQEVFGNQATQLKTLGIIKNS